MFAVTFRAKEARSALENAVVTPAGTLMLLAVDPEGWASATGRRLWPKEAAAFAESGSLPARAKVFETREAADDFMRSWDPHPWYAAPETWTVVEVQRQTTTVETTAGWLTVAAPKT
jgi:hypothetical protein